MQHKRIEISSPVAPGICAVYSFKYSGFCICRRHLDAEDRPYAARAKTAVVQVPELAANKYGRGGEIVLTDTAHIYLSNKSLILLKLF